MYCLSPITCYAVFNEKGYIDQPLSFYEVPGGVPFEVDCGKCAGCLRKQSLQRLLLLNLDISQHTYYNEKLDTYVEPKQCMLTLTYDPDNITFHGGLNYLDYSLFQKSLKQYLRRNGLEYKLRGVFSGEIGPNGTHRPHFHIYFTNFAPDDARYLYLDFKSFSRGSRREYKTSRLLEHFWNKGFLTVVDGNIKTRSYVLGYTFKKIQYLDNEYLKKISSSTIKRKQEHNDLLVGVFSGFFEQFEFLKSEGLISDKDYNKMIDTYEQCVMIYQALGEKKQRYRCKYHIYKPALDLMTKYVDADDLYNDEYKDFFHSICDKFVYIEGRKYLNTVFPCGRCIWDAKKQLALPAEKMRLFGGLGDSYYEIFKNDIVRGYITDPYSKIKCKIPLKFMTKLKEDDFKKYEQIRIHNALKMRDVDKNETRKKREEYAVKLSSKVAQGFNIKSRELDFSPLTEQEEEEINKEIGLFDY